MDERKMILEMVKEGRITPDEALTLLDALGQGAAAPQNGESATFRIDPMVTKSGDGPRRFWIRREAPAAGAKAKTKGVVTRIELRKGSGSSLDVDELIRRLEKTES